VEKYGRATQATDDNIVHAHCILDTYVENIKSEYVICIAFSLHQYLHECALILRYNQLSCVPVQYLILLVYFNIFLNEVAVVSWHRKYLFQII